MNVLEVASSKSKNLILNYGTVCWYIFVYLFTIFLCWYLLFIACVCECVCVLIVWILESKLNICYCLRPVTSVLMGQFWRVIAMLFVYYCFWVNYCKTNNNDNKNNNHNSKYNIKNRRKANNNLLREHIETHEHESRLQKYLCCLACAAAN